MKPGIYSTPRDEYDRLSSRANWSRLKWMDKSPAHYRELTVNPPEDTDPKKRGRATHVATLEPELYRERFAVWDGRRAGKEWEKFRDEHESFGREVITEAMNVAALAVAKAVRSDAAAIKYVSGGKGEQTLIWDHAVPALEGLPGYVIPCKGRPDFLSNLKAIVDLKTTRDASPEGFAREVMRYGYHAQAAFYVDGHAAVNGGERWPYVFVAVEPTPPYPVTVFRVPPEVLHLGREKYRALLDRLHLCMESSEWPAYATGEVDLLLPEWAMPIDARDADGLGLVFGDA